MISLLVVNYRSAALAAEAVRTARESASEPLDVVIVDNSEDASEAADLRSIEPDALVVAPRNLGYAGGINLGWRSCRGEPVVVSNPDVTYAPGALDLLASSVRTGAAAAGPAFFWDAAMQWRMPPGDVQDAWGKLDDVLASRSVVWREERDRRRIRRRAAFWSLTGPAAVDTLSGAVLAIDRAAYDAVRGFDERFALYFEETDFLRSLRAQRRRIVSVPAARCRHLFNQSAGLEAEKSAARFAQSEARYLEKWHGPLLARVLARLGRAVPPPDLPVLETPVTIARANVVAEISPLPSFATAAGCFPPPGTLEVPPDIVASLRDVPLYLRVVDRTSGAVLTAGQVA